MKKTVTVNISGIIFHIDEDAYEKISRYLDRIKRYFMRSDGRDEIIGDIEGRIAEILQGKINENRQVITIEDVTEVISNMGEPSDFDESGESDNKQEAQERIYASNRPKRLYRDPDNKTIAGVASGLAAYFNVDPVWIKVLFIVSLFISGTGLIAYIFLWIIVPEARTTTEKLEMRGEQVNISNIERSIRDEFDGIKGRMNDFAEEAGDVFKKRRPVAKTFISKLISFLGTIIAYFFKFIVVMVGLVLMFSGFAFIILMLASITGLYSFSFFEHGELISFSIPVFLQMFFTSHFITFLAITSVALLLGIPIIMMIYLGFRLILGNRVKVRYFGTTALAFWLVGLVLAFYVGVNTGRDFRHSARITKNYDVQVKSGNILNISANDDNDFKDTEPHIRIFDHAWNVEFSGDNYLIFAIPQIEIEKSNSAISQVEVLAYAKGSDRMEAEERAKSCVYNIVTNDSAILLPHYFKLPFNEIIRNQQVKLKIKIPVGQIVKFDENMKMLFFDNPYGNYDLRDFPGKTMIMTEDGLKPYKADSGKILGKSNAQDLKSLKNHSAENEISENLSMLSLKCIGL